MAGPRERQVVNANETIDSFRQKFNKTSEDVGATNQLTTTEDSDIVGAINEHDAELGTITSVAMGTTASTVSTAIAELDGRLDSINDTLLNTPKLWVSDSAATSYIEGGLHVRSDATISSNLTVSTGLTVGGVTFASHDSDISRLNTFAEPTRALDTTASTLPAAINELKTAVDLLDSGASDQIASIGDLPTLTTTAKDTLVNAINEVDSDVSTLTTNQDNLADGLRAVDLGSHAKLTLDLFGGGTDDVALYGTGGVTVTYDSAGGISFSSSIDANTTYDLSTTASSPGVRLVGNDATTDYVLFKGSNITITRDSDKGITFGVSSGVDTTYAMTMAQTGGTNADPALTLTPSSGVADTVAFTGGTAINVTRTSDTGVTIAHADTSSITGAQGSSGISSITVDGNGHVTAVSTATYDNYSSWTAADSDGTTYTITSGDTLTIRGDQVGITTNFVADDVLRISHADTSSQASVNNTGGAYIQDVTLDQFGHVTALTSTTVAYADVSGTPTIPTVNDATITLSAGTALTGGGNFTTNQSGNETITFNVDYGTDLVIKNSAGTTLKTIKGVA